ncbi:MAG: hypothetical protein MZW92_39040 [Comamonadaceae bacterium]|nr:hypothetical protein [Comamonadaceae bacterium]
MNRRYPKSFQRLILTGFLLVATPLALAIGYAVFTLQGPGRARANRRSSAPPVRRRASRQFAESLIGMERALRQYAVLRDAELVEDYRRLSAESAAGGRGTCRRRRWTVPAVSASVRLLERERKIHGQLVAQRRIPGHGR